MLNNHYCSTYMMAYHHLLSRRSPKVYGKTKSRPTEGRKMPTPGSKSMVEGLTIMLGVSRALLYTQPMPNNNYCSTYMMASCSPASVLRKSVGKRNLDPPEGRKTQTPGHKSMVEGLTIMLGVFRDLLYTYTMPNNQTTTIVAPT